MDYINKNKFLVVVVILLVILNVVSISFNLFFKEPRTGIPHEKEKRDPLQNFIDRDLQFSEEQNKKYAELRDKHFQIEENITSLRTDAMKSLFELFKKDNISEEEIIAKASAVGATDTKRSIETIKYFIAIRDICNPVQREKLYSIVFEALERVKGPAPDGNGPMPGNGPRPGEQMPPGGGFGPNGQQGFDRQPMHGEQPGGKNPPPPVPIGQQKNGHQLLQK